MTGSHSGHDLTLNSRARQVDRRVRKRAFPHVIICPRVSQCTKNHLACENAVALVADMVELRQPRKSIGPPSYSSLSRRSDLMKFLCLLSQCHKVCAFLARLLHAEARFGSNRRNRRCDANKCRVWGCRGLPIVERVVCAQFDDVHWSLLSHRHARQRWTDFGYARQTRFSLTRCRGQVSKIFIDY